MAHNGIYFSLGAVAIRTGSNIVGSAQVPGALTLSVSTPLIKTMGGASSFPTHARPGRSEGELTLTLNQRPTWIDEMISGGTSSEASASTTATVGSLSNVVGSSMASKTTIAIASGATPTPGLYQVTASATTAADIRVVGPNGVYESSVTGVSSTAKAIPNTGLTILASSSFTQGNAISFEVTPAHDGITTIAIPQVREGTEYELIAYSATGGTGDNVEVLTVPRVVFAGADFTLTDNEAVTVEMAGAILSPLDGGAVFTRKTIE